MPFTRLAVALAIAVGVLGSPAAVAALTPAHPTSPADLPAGYTVVNGPGGVRLVSPPKSVACDPAADPKVDIWAGARQAPNGRIRLVDVYMWRLPRTGAYFGRQRWLADDSGQPLARWRFGHGRARCVASRIEVDYQVKFQGSTRNHEVDLDLAIRPTTG